MRWTGTLVELGELIYGLQEMRRIDDDCNDKEQTSFFCRIFDMEIKGRTCYDTYLDIERCKNDSRIYFLNKLRKRLNLWMLCDDEKKLGRYKVNRAARDELLSRVFSSFDVIRAHFDATNYQRVPCRQHFVKSDLSCFRNPMLK